MEIFSRGGDGGPHHDRPLLHAALDGSCAGRYGDVAAICIRIRGSLLCHEYRRTLASERYGRHSRSRNRCRERPPLACVDLLCCAQRFARPNTRRVGGGVYHGSVPRIPFYWTEGTTIFVRRDWD